MDFSFQLYSARKFEPWEDVFAMLADAGYRRVEGFGALYKDVDRLRAMLDGNKLSMPTAHFGLDLLEGDFERAMAIADTLGVETVVCPHIAAELRPTDSAGWRAFAARLARIGENCQARGRGFAWHNHDFEFAATGDGQIPQRIILDAAPDIGWEIDVAWVVRGGGDPMNWIDEYASRIVAVHVKDIAPAGEAADEDGWADIGEGTIDWRALFARLRSQTRATHFIMEHDNPSDAARFARRSIEAARKLMEQGE